MQKCSILDAKLIIDNIMDFAYTLQIGKKPLSQHGGCNPFKGKKMMKIFMTHPPIEDRIKALRGMEI